jgi:acetyl esterase/lipase
MAVATCRRRSASMSRSHSACRIPLDETLQLWFCHIVSTSPSHPLAILPRSSLIQRCQFPHLADLACESANRYPRQLQQAVALLGHLLHVEKVLPSSITLLGDSAGAHLLLSLVLHLSHPNPLVTPLKFSGRLSGAVLVSPWVTMDTSAASMQLNKDKDMLSASSLEYWARNFLGGADYDSWNTPTMAPEEWWGDLLVDDILVLYGHDELLRDDTLIFCERLRVSAYWCSLEHICFSTHAAYRLAMRKQPCWTSPVKPMCTC